MSEFFDICFFFGANPNPRQQQTINTVCGPHTGHSWIFEPVNLTDFSQFSSISPGNFRNWVLSFPSHFTGSFVPLITQKSPFSEAFHHFHTDNTHHFE
jgi:hypothetical protein